MNSIMTVMTYIIYEYEGCRHSKGPLPGVECSLPHPILFRGGATHYSDGEDRRALYYLGAEPLTIPMVRTGGARLLRPPSVTHYSYGEGLDCQGRHRSLTHSYGWGAFDAQNRSYSKKEFDPGSERTLAICLTHASRTWLASPSIHVGAEGQKSQIIHKAS